MPPSPSRHRATAACESWTRPSRWSRNTSGGRTESSPFPIRLPIMSAPIAPAVQSWWSRTVSTRAFLAPRLRQRSMCPVNSATVSGIERDAPTLVGLGVLLPLLGADLALALPDHQRRGVQIDVAARMAHSSPRRAPMTTASPDEHAPAQVLPRGAQQRRGFDRRQRAGGSGSARPACAPDVRG